MRTLIDALGIGWAQPAARWTALAAFAVLLPVYAVTLPASLTGGYIGWVSLRLLTPGMAAIAVVLSAILSFTLALMVVLVRSGQRARKGAAAGGAVVAFVTPLLCCTPVLPLALGTLAVAFPALAGMAAGSVQGFIATHETAILVAAVVLSTVALYQNAARVSRGAAACRVPRPPKPVRSERG